jgi:hypothetical protein
VTTYTAFGLRIQSTVGLPPLTAGDESAAEVEVRTGTVRPLVGSAGIEGCVRASRHECLLSWRAVGAFLVRGGTEVIIDPAPEADPLTVRQFLLGPAMAVLLHQRGHLVLHASAVSLNGAVVGFLGPSGSGKSTLAAALHARGWTIVADDVLPAAVTGHVAVAYPGFPEIRLWPAAAKELAGHLQSQAADDSRTDKRAYAAGRSFSTGPLPIRCLYSLVEGSTSRSAAIEPTAAFVEILRHTYTARLLESSPATDHFAQCSSLASAVRVRRLTSARSPAELVALADVVEKDLALA